MEFTEIVDVRESDGDRTRDVEATAQFGSLMLSPSSVSALSRLGFLRPSPIQARAIPLGLLRLDLLVQAKSGTGKTLVFALLAVESLNLQVYRTQVLIVAPTREIAQQIAQTISALAQPQTRIRVIIGGTQVQEDRDALKRGCHVVVGTAGRLVHMVQSRVLDCNHVRLFVLDEADKLMDATFHQDINFLFSSLPVGKQIAVFSATYPRRLDAVLGRYMRSPTWVRLDANDVQLLGLLQYAIESPAMDEMGKMEKLAQFLTQFTFNQCIVFVNTHSLCAVVAGELRARGFDVAAMSSTLTQDERLRTLKKLQLFQIRILVTTDLTARGIDAANVNFVVNFECPVDGETYFHRIGRAGRFGGRGACCSLLFGDEDICKFSRLASDQDFHVRVLHEHFPADLATNREFWQSLPEMKKRARSRQPAQHVNGVPSRRLPSGPAVRDLVSGHVNGVWRYSREDLCAMREYAGILDDELQTHVAQLEIAKGQSFAAELRELESMLQSSPAPARTLSPMPEKLPPLPRFVPSRLGSKRKFYLRGELLAIRNAINARDWRRYARTRFDFTQEPFTKIEHEERETMREEKKEACVTQATVHRYDRSALIAMRCAILPHVWLAYARRRFASAINDEPFQLDEQLRCPYELQLRVLRAREEAKMKKQRGNVEQPVTADVLLAAHGARRWTNHYPMSASFQEYCTNTGREFGQLLEQGKDPCARREAGLIPTRRAPGEWQVVIENACRVLTASRVRFETACNRDLGQLHDVAVQCDEIDDEREVVQVPPQATSPMPCMSSVGTPEMRRWATALEFSESFSRLFSTYIQSARRIPFA